MDDLSFDICKGSKVRSLVNSALILCLMVYTKCSQIMEKKIAIKRVYENPEKSDGFRVLIDRLWPRGLTKEKAKVDLWLKEISPSTELRKWFGHDAEKWKEFQKRYTAELREHKEAIKALKDKISEGKVTLVYGARDEAHNDAVVLHQLLEK